jgi:pimeloyl-ACP methyl ester carboxylesterase
VEPPDALAAEERRVVCLNLRGAGGSLATESGWTTADMAADVAGLIEALGLDTPVLVGLSLGGSVALHAALDRPDLVGGVVAYGPPGFGFPPAGSGLEAWSAYTLEQLGRIASLPTTRAIAEIRMAEASRDPDNGPLAHRHDRSVSARRLPRSDRRGR